MTCALKLHIQTTMWRPRIDCHKGGGGGGDRRRKVTCMTFNCQSLVKKDEIVGRYIRGEKMDFAVLTETWYSDHRQEQIKTSDLTKSGYKLYVRNRQNKTRGGIALACKDHIDVTEVEHGPSQTYEYGIWKLVFKKCSLHVIGIYRPPKSSTSKFMTEFFALIKKTSEKCSNILVMGDFNIGRNEKFRSMLYDSKLEQFVTFSTHKLGNILDQVITETQDNVIVCSCEKGPFFSDHCVVKVTLKVKKETSINHGPPHRGPRDSHGPPLGPRGQQQQGPTGDQRELPAGHPHPRHGPTEGHPDRRPPPRQGPPERNPDLKPPRPGPSTDKHDLSRDYPDWRPRSDTVPAHELSEGHPERSPRPPPQHPEGFYFPEGHPDRRPPLEREAPPHDQPEGHPNLRAPVRPGGAKEWEQAREEDWQKPHWGSRARPGEPHFHEDAEYRRGGRGRGRFPSRRGKARGRGGPEEFSAWRSPREEQEREWVEERGSGRRDGRGRGRQDRRHVGRGPPNVQWIDQALKAERYRDEAGPQPEEYVSREEAGEKPDHTEHLPAFLGPANPKPNHHGPGEQHGPAGFRPRMMDPRSQGPRRGMPQERPHRGPRPMPPSMIRPRVQGPGMFDGLPMPSQVDSYIDKFGDPRFRCFNDMGPEVSEEVVLGKRNYEIKLGAPARKIQWGNETIEVYADPSKRGVVIDGTLMYKFLERVKEVTIRARKVKIFYHGKPVNLWLDGQQYEVRIDSPPKALIINGKHHRIQVDGRDMMILRDKVVEVGKFGEPRFVFIDEERMEMRFDPPPRHILIDNKLLELKLNTNQPCVSIEGKLHGMRFDGGPKEVVINNCLYNIFPDHANKLRVGNSFHYVSLGGPCFELIVDGKWFEVKFNEEPKEINLGNIVLMVQLKGAPPEVKILPEIFLPPSGPPMPGTPLSGPPMSGPPMVKHGPPLSVDPYLQPLVPSSMPFPSTPLAGMPPMPQMGMVSSTQRMMSVPTMMSTPQMMNAPAGLGLLPMVVPSSMPQDPLSAPSISGIPGIEPSNPVSSAAPVSQPTSVPNLLSSLFPIVSKPSLSAASKPTGPIDINSLLNNLVKTGILKQEQERAKSGKREHKPETSRPELGPLAKDWIMYDEMTTPDEGSSNFFEQQNQTNTTGAPATPPQSMLPDGAVVAKCPAATGKDAEDMCNICHEPFEQYWDEAAEEWHLRDAIKVNNKTYHPICYEDYTDMCNICHEPFEQYWDKAYSSLPALRRWF